MKKFILYPAIALLSFAAGYTIATHNSPAYCEGLGKSWKDIAKSRLEMIIAQDELLHEVMCSDIDKWMDVIMEGDAYATLDSVRDGYWEDFYYITKQDSINYDIH